MTRCRSARPRIAALLVPAALLAVLGLSAVPALAGSFYDVTLDLGLRDDAHVFLNVTNDYFHPAPAVALALVKRCPSPVDDYPVVLMLARASRRSPEDILGLRLDYLSWSDIMFRLNVSPGILFTGMDRDPGPPYGKAWGYWRKHPRGSRFEIRDREVVELAKLQVAAAYHRISPYSILAERNRGVSVEQYVAGKNRHKYAREKGTAGPTRGKAHGKPKGSDKTQGHGKPHHND